MNTWSPMQIAGVQNNSIMNFKKIPIYLDFLLSLAVDKFWVFFFYYEDEWLFFCCSFINKFKPQSIKNYILKSDML